MKRSRNFYAADLAPKSQKSLDLRDREEIYVPELGSSEKNVELGSSPNELALHADDFDFALEILRGVSFVASHPFAAIGHSAGGEVAIELAFRHPDIKAVIGLDGSFGMTSGQGSSNVFPNIGAARNYVLLCWTCGAA